jgi:hypothetical protein
VKPASTLWFPQYDHVVSAAIEGSGVAMGVLPHVAHLLREGALCAPLGHDGVAHRGTFFVVPRPDVAGREALKAFIAWLWKEVRGEDEFSLAPVRAAGARARAARR